MGFFDIFKKRVGQTPIYSDRDIQAISESANSIVRVFNDSLKIAHTTNNIDTKISRTQIAREKLSELEDMAAQYSFVSLPNLAKVEQDLAFVEKEISKGNYAQIAQDNLAAQELEKQGNVEAAIEIYEQLAADGTDTPFTYRRLAIIYSKQKRYDNELSVVEQALANIPKSNVGHYEWFQKRHAKALARSERTSSNGTGL